MSLINCTILFAVLISITDAEFTNLTLTNGDIVSVSENNTIEVWNSTDGTLKMILTGHTDHVDSLTTLPNDDIVSGSLDKTIRIWSSIDGTLKITLNIDKLYTRIYTKNISNEAMMKSISLNKTIKIYSSNDGIFTVTLIYYKNYAYAMTTHPNGDLKSGITRKNRVWWRIN
jgi:WD40 repeat protein